MRVLAVDTTTIRGSVAVVEDGEVKGELRVVSESAHSRRLMPAIDFLLQSLSLDIQDVSGYAVTIGPGSFTGLRIGIATVQGLGLGHPAPCLGVSALDVLAARAAGSADVVVAVMDAWRDEVYAGVYDARGAVREGPLVLAPGALIARVPAGPAAFFGDGVLRYRELFASRPQALLPERSLFLAGTLGRLAGMRLRAGEGGGPETLTPVYVRDSGAAKPRP
jgi:tRNA threonylcarbamoyl adenosine modification protein YeaZ